MHCPHPSTPSKLIKNVYIYKQENGAFNSDCVNFSVTLARNKEREYSRQPFKIFTLNVGQYLLEKIYWALLFVRECWTTLFWRCCYYYSLKYMSKYVGWRLKESWVGKEIWVVLIWMGGISCCTVFSSLALTNSSYNWQGFGSTFSLGSYW